MIYTLRASIILTVAGAMLAGCIDYSPVTSTAIHQSPTYTPTDDIISDWYPLPTYSSYFPPSNIPGYTRYIPSETSELRLEFEYPNTWIFSEHVSETGSQSIFLGDARFQTLATPAPDDYHPTPNDFGNVFIWIMSAGPGETVESKAEDQKTSYRNIGWATFLNDYNVAIDGFGARVIEHQIQMPDTHTSQMFERRIYFFAENEIYAIFFTIAEKDRGGEFEQGYEYFFNSLKVVRQNK